MKINADISLDMVQLNDFYLSLLKEEDYDFKTKDIRVDINKCEKGVKVTLGCDNILDLKIGMNALIKSLETIDKTLKV